MPPIVSSIEIARPPEEVFSYVTDPSRFAEWQHDVVSVRMEGGRPPGVGSRFTTTRRIGGTERTMTQEITEIDAPRSWAAHGVDGPIRPNAGSSRAAASSAPPASAGMRSALVSRLSLHEGVNGSTSPRAASLASSDGSPSVS
jgi:uncharacterized protein YndB with AHSA1/START domain